jgi:hypothetical protein
MIVQHSSNDASIRAQTEVPLLRTDGDERRNKKSARALRRMGLLKCPIFLVLTPSSLAPVLKENLLAIENN